MVRALRYDDVRAVEASADIQARKLRELAPTILHPLALRAQQIHRLVDDFRA